MSADGEAGWDLPTLVCGGRPQPGLVIDIDATLVRCHSEKEGTAATYKSGYGDHPMLAWLDNTGEALSGGAASRQRDRERRRRPHPG